MTEYGSGEIDARIVGAKREGYFKGYDHRADTHTEIINYEAIKQAKREVIEMVFERIKEINHAENGIYITSEEWQSLKQELLKEVA